MVKKLFNPREIDYSWYRREIKGIRDFKCDLAPTGKAKCYTCRTEVPFKTPRIWFEDKMDKTIKGKDGKEIKLEEIEVKRIICYKCAPYYLQEQYEIFKEKAKEIARTIKKFKRSKKGKLAKGRIEALEIVNNIEEKDETNNKELPKGVTGLFNLIDSLRKNKY